MYPSILITDDEQDFRATLRGLFEVRGFRTLEAGDGEEAISIARREPVHLLLSDMHMPRMNGLQVIERIKSIRALVPCILLSAAADEQLIEEARRVQTFTVLSKTASSRHILRSVLQAMRMTYSWPDGGLPAPDSRRE